MPVELCRVIRQIGFDELLGNGIGRGNVLRRALEGIEKVLWGRVDPLGTTVPSIVRFGTPVFVGGDAVPWRPSAPGGGDLDVVDALKRGRDQQDGRGYRLHGSMNAKERREPDNGYGLRMDSWEGIPVDQMRLGGPGRWESVAIARFREYLDREDGLSVRGRWRLANDPRQNSRMGGPVQRARGRRNVRHDVRRNEAQGNDHNAARGRGRGAVAQRGRGREDAARRGCGRGVVAPRGRGHDSYAAGDGGHGNTAPHGRGNAPPRGRGGGTDAAHLRGGEAGPGRGSGPPAGNMLQAAGVGRGLSAVRPAWMTSSSGSAVATGAPEATLPRRRSAPEADIEPPTKRNRVERLLSVARAAGIPAAEATPEGRAHLALLVATGAAALMVRTGTRVEVSADLRRLLSLSPTPEVRALVPEDESPFLVQSTPESSARLRALALIVRRLREIHAHRAAILSQNQEDGAAALTTTSSATAELQPAARANVQAGSTTECEITPQEPGAEGSTSC